MTPRQRELAAVRIRARALAWSVGFASLRGDRLQRASCGRRGWRRCAPCEQLRIFPEYLLTDFRLELPQLDIGQTALVKGDACCLSIAAASVLAKTGRDALMRELDAQQPGYGLATHKGYGTPDHLLALKRMGRSPIHRKTFCSRACRVRGRFAASTPGSGPARSARRRKNFVISSEMAGRSASPSTTPHSRAARKWVLKTVCRKGTEHTSSSRAIENEDGQLHVAIREHADLKDRRVFRAHGVGPEELAQARA